MDIAAYISLLMVLSLLLVKSADLIEESFVEIAKRLKISPFMVGFFIIAGISSLPEASVAISSAIDQVPQLSVGNLLGATFTLLTLVVGANAIKEKGIPFKGKFGVGQVVMALLLLCLQIFVVLDGELRFEEGILLVSVYILFVIYIGDHIRSHRKLDEDSTIQLGKLSRMVIKGLIGLAALLVLSNVIVAAAIKFAELIHIPNSVVGMLILAFGTNIPEITLLFASKSLEQRKLAIGGFIGSACVNTLILGILALISPVTLTSLPVLILPLILMGTALGMFAVFTVTDSEINKQEGIMLVGLYALFIVVQALQIFVV